MALLNQQLQRFFLTTLNSTSNFNLKATKRNNSSIALKERARCCSAIAIDAPSTLSDVGGIRWGLSRLQGRREEMEDDAVIRSEGLDGFSFAAVFDGHAGFSSVKFLRDELYKECLAALQGGLLLKGKNFNTIQEALERAFQIADTKLLNWLETSREDVESGSTATVMLIGDGMVFISHVGDSCVVLSRSGKAEVLTNPHRPYGSNKSSLQEIRRIREAGGWIVNGRICGDIAVSRAFGDMRFKTKKNEMLEKGLEDGRWSQKFISRVQFTGDLVVASPDVLQVALGSDAEFLLLASDGLWDYMNSSEAVTFVRNQLRQHADVQVACEALALAALDRGSQDNVSIIIADLGGLPCLLLVPRRTDWRSLPLQQQNLFLELAQALATVGIVTLGIWMSSQFGLLN